MLAAGLAGAAALAAPAAAHAESVEVTTLGDTPVDGKTTLREAIASAEDSGEDSAVTFASAVRGVIELSGSNIEYDGAKGGALDIQGPGAGELTVKGSNGPPSGIFSFEGSDAAIKVSGLTLTRGVVGEFIFGVTPSVDDTGGAILSQNTDLTVSNATITQNAAKYGGGGIAQYGGSLTVEQSQVDDNRLKFTPEVNRGEAGGGILAVGAPVTITRSSVNSNEAEGAFGGGIAVVNAPVQAARATPLARLARQTRGVDGEVEITDSTVSGNSGGLGGGGIFFAPNDDVSITRSTFDDNEASGLTVPAGPTDGAARQTRGDTGPGPMVPAPNTEDVPGAGGGAVLASSTADVSESTFSANKAVVDREPDENEEPDESFEKGSVRGGDVEDEDVFASQGGGLFLVSDETTVSNSTLAANAADLGGGILTGGEPTEEEEPEAPTGPDNPTDPGDTGDGPGTPPEDGVISSLRAAVRGEDDGEDEAALTTAIDNSTVSGNEAVAGGGVFTYQGGFQASSTIVAGNTADEDDDVSADEGSVDAEYSLIQTPGNTLESSQSNITGQPAQLGGLAENGGPTKTLLPANSSPAIDQGTANGLDTDQRGFARTSDLGPANATDGTDIGAVEIQATTPATTPNTTGTPGATPRRPITPSSVPASCSRRALSLTDARVKDGKVVLKGLVGSRFYGKKVTIQTDPEGAKASGYSKTATATAAKKDGTFTVSVSKPSKDDYPTVRYRAKIGRATSAALKLPQSLTLKSVKSAKGTITVTGRVDEDVLGKRNKVTIRRLACGRYRTVGRVKPDADGSYSLTIKATKLRGVGLYRAEASVLVRPESKKYVKQYARAISIKTTGQTG